MARTTICVSLLLLALCACAAAVEIRSDVPQLFDVVGRSPARKLMQSGFGNAWGVPADTLYEYTLCRINVIDVTDCRRGESFACCEETKLFCTGIRTPRFKCKAWTYSACCKSSN